jgi:hypothetical protein
VQSLLKFLFFLALLTLALGVYMGDALPPPQELLPQLGEEPRQTPTSRPPFEVTVNQRAYRVTPLYQYELYGLVVSKHEADSFLDYAHKEWGDALNAADVCVVWGDNARSGVYQRLDFSSGQWTCYYETSSTEDWRQFSERQISNNHLLADRRELQSALKRTRVGDQIHFRGFLAEYSHGDYRRGSSVTRDDNGNGACETVYLESFDILRRGPALWRTLRWVSAAALLACVLAWFFLPARPELR